MIQGIDRRGLDLKPDCFRYRYAFGNAQIDAEIVWTRQTVYGEITECARGRCRHQARLKPGRRGLSDNAALTSSFLSLGTHSDVKKLRIDKEDSPRVLIQTNILLELFKGNAG